MKSNVCPVTGEAGQLEALLAEVEKFTSFQQLEPRHALRVRLLAEEVVSMLPELMEKAEGNFWIENEENQYRLNLSMKAKNTAYDARKRLVGISTAGKNAAAVGIMGKIREAAELLLYQSDDIAFENHYFLGMDTKEGFSQLWTLSSYESELKAQKEEEKDAEAWDELEKSIIAKLADDVEVSIRGKRVDIVIRKEFA